MLLDMVHFVHKFHSKILVKKKKKRLAVLFLYVN